MRKLSTALLALNPVLWASFYALSKPALARVNPLVFATLEVSIAAVPAAVLILIYYRKVAWRPIGIGAILGLILFGAVMGSTIALYYTTATDTAFFPALNGAIAALIGVLFFKQRIAPRLWGAVALATAGAFCLILTSHQGGGNVHGDLVALGGAAIYTLYIFAVDHFADRLADHGQVWLAAGTEILVMAALAWIVLFGIVGGLPPVSTATLYTAGYVGLFTTFLPTVLALLFQRHVEPMTVALLYVLEPIWGAIAAALLDGERLTIAGYCGGELIVAGSVLAISKGERSAG